MKKYDEQKNVKKSIKIKKKVKTMKKTKTFKLREKTQQTAKMCKKNMDNNENMRRK